jgi:hypothetical protein
MQIGIVAKEVGLSYNFPASSGAAFRLIYAMAEPVDGPTSEAGIPIKKART